MNTDLFEKLYEEGCISEESLNRIRHKRQHPLFSLHWELKTLLYLGVMLLSTGLGVLIYKNIDTIGHQVIIAAIAAISTGCFVYCYKHKKPFDRQLVKSTGALFDYLLLLACLSFVSFLGYLQFQYTVFGTSYGLATFIPMVVLFYVAYDFDHLGILSMAVTNLGIWLGLSLSPIALLTKLETNDQTLIFTCLFLGLFLMAVSYLSARYDFKAHFRFTYMHFAVHLTFLSILSAYFYNYDRPGSVLWLFLTFAVAYYVYMDALKQRSFYFLLLMVLYVYISAAALFLRTILLMEDVAMFYLASLYFICSAIAIIKLLRDLNKKVKSL